MISDWLKTLLLIESVGNNTSQDNGWFLLNKKFQIVNLRCRENRATSS